MASPIEVRVDVEDGIELAPVAGERASSAAESHEISSPHLESTENGTSISPAIIPYEGTDGSAKSARDSSSLNIHRVSLTKPRRRVMSASAPSYWSNTISTVFSSVDYDTDGTDDSDDPDDVDNPPPLTSLHQAARDDLSKVVTAWIKYFSQEGETDVSKLNERDGCGMAPIHYAAKFNRLRILRKLFNSGADFTLATTEEQYTPLHFSASYIPRYKVQQDGPGNQVQKKSYLTSSKETVEFLVYTVKVEVNPKGKNNVTPLHLACHRGNLEAALILLSQSVITIECNIQDTHGDTPLHQACRYGHEEIVIELLKDEHLPKSLHTLCNREKQTPLHLACQEGHTAIVRKLLEKCPLQEDGRKLLLNAHDNEGNTALHLAVESLKMVKNQEPEIVKVLLKYGADPSEVKVAKQTTKKRRRRRTMEIGDRSTPLHLAARYGLVKVITVLLDHCPDSIDALTRNNQTPLHLAAIYNQVGAAELLIARGANTEWKDVNSCTPFLVAATHGSAGVVAKLEEIEDIPIQVDKLDKNRKSAVFLAAEGAHYPLLRHLLGTHNRHDVHSMSFTSSIQRAFETPLVQISRSLCSNPDVDLNTPLHIAAKHGHMSIVEEFLKDELLRQDHVKLDARNLMNKTPAHLAAEYGHYKILEKLILKNKCLVYDEDNDGNTPLHLAAQQGWKHAVRLLLERKANIDARNADLATPLSLAAGSGHEHIVMLLLQSKAEVDTQDRSQATPLHYSIIKGRTCVVKILLSNGASCSHRDTGWYNALDLAIEFGHEDVARIIVQSKQWEDALRNTTEGSITKEPTTPFRKLILKMPDVAREVLNRCTVYKEEDGVSDIKYNYRYLEDFRPSRTHRASSKMLGWCLPWWMHHNFPTQGYRNTWGPKSFSRSNHPLTIMAESKESRLLSHPLVISLLMFKLRSYASACYLSQFFIHCILLFCLTFFALQVFHPNDTICRVMSQQDFNMTEILNGSETCDEPYENDTQRAQCGSCASNEKLYKYGVSTLAFGVIFASFIRTMVLLFKFISYSRHLKTLWSFMTDFQNWIEVPMLILSVVFVSVFTNDCLCPTKWQWEIGIFAILFVWFDFIIFIGYLQLYISDIGIYVLMFGYMIKTFVQALFLSVPILIAFTLAFHMAFYSPRVEFSPFSDPAQTIVTVLSYSLGLADYNVLFALSQEGEMDNVRPRENLVLFPVASTILWVLFLIVMLILLVNMLIGLAVEDIKGIKRAAEVQRLKLLVDLTLSIDSVLPYRHLFTIPEGTTASKRKGLNLWRRFNDFLWKGMIEQDTPKKIAEALVNHSEPSVDHIYTHTNSLVKEQASVREALRAMNERNRRMEADLTYIRSVLKRQFGTSPSAELELRTFPGDY